MSTETETVQSDRNNQREKLQLSDDLKKTFGETFKTPLLPPVNV